MDALPSRGAAPQTGHVCFRPRFVQEYQAGRIEGPAQRLPLLPGLCNVRAVLLAGPERLFLYVRSMSTNT